MLSLAPRCHCALKRPFPGLAKDLLKSTPEVLVEDGVDDRVERAVAVTDPEEKLKKGIGDGACFPADPVQTVAEEEWEPAHHKHAHDNGQYKSESFFSGLRDLFSGNGVPPLST